MSRKIVVLILLLSCCHWATAEKGSFRFAHLTDLHISPTNGAPTEDLLFSVAQINATDSIDFVLVTGDITEEGDWSSMMKVKSVLDLLKVDYYITSGNHETKWSESGCTAFSEIFGSERFSLYHRGYLFLGFNSGPLMRMAYGHVVPQDIDWIKKEINKYGASTPVFLATHYPMLAGDVDNWYEVTDAVRSYNVRSFIGGHYHRNLHLQYDGIPGILGRSNLRDKDGKQGYTLYEVRPDSMIVYEQRIGETKKRWAALSMTDQTYTHQGGATSYPDFSMNKTYTQVKEVWEHASGAGIYSSPVVEGDRLFVGDDLGRLSCYQLKRGKLLWQFNSTQRIVGTPAVSAGVVVFGSADRTIYGVEAKSGKELWRVQAEQPVLGAVAIEGETAYIGASDHTLRAINIRTGAILWQYTQVKGYIETKPLVLSDRIVFGAWDNTLYALEKVTGKELWRWTGGLTRMHFSPAVVWPVAAHGKVFITDPQRAMTAVDLKTGTTIWRTYQSMVRETIGLSEDSLRVYSKTMRDSVVCYSAEGDQPRQLWATSVDFGYEHAPSMMIEKEGVVYGSTKEGVIFALEGRSGKLLWKHKVGNSLINTVLPLEGRRLLFTSTDGKIGLLRSEK